MRDHHQKVRQIREGDVIAVPTGVTQWVYNNGRTPLVLVQVVDTNNPANQLDQNHRVFFVAGNPQLDVQSKKGESQRGERSERGLTRKPAERDTAGNVFSGMDERVLAEAFNVNTDVARRLRGEDDYRGMIVTVERGLEVLTPQRSPEEERQIKEEEQQKQFELGPSRGTGGYNGVEETLCTAKLRHNVNDPSDTDIFNPRAGRITTVNSHVVPILRNLQFTVQKGVLYRNAIFAPHWNVNAHSVNYVVRGNGHVQMVDDNGNTVFDGQVQEGQMFVAPQNFVVVKKASEQGMEWVSFKTNDAAKVCQLAGRVSAIRSMPVEVLANAFQVSIEEAMRIKNNRQEVTLLSPRTRSRFNVTEGSE
ncbi:hypothetical protein MANES_03G163900v8 [Manihot esculenta]|nr:hypothetical protein MANES_03G163900v8 [Manihot esculenta]